MQSYVSVSPDCLLQSKQSQFTGSGEGLSRLDIVIHEAAHSRLPCAWAFYHFVNSAHSDIHEAIEFLLSHSCRDMSADHVRSSASSCLLDPSSKPKTRCSAVSHRIRPVDVSRGSQTQL